jgi:antitoxin MazE
LREPIAEDPQVSQWGNSLGIRIPKAYAAEVGLSEGTIVEITLSGRKLAVTRAEPEYKLEELVAGITPQNRHGETDWGEAASKETW